MSRSNTNYYTLCDAPLDADGYCKWHEGGWGRRQRTCLVEREIAGRRGVWARKKRFPNWSWKRHCRNPPRSMKRLWQRKLRTMQKVELLRSGEVLLDADKMLIGWYGWWS